MRVSGDKAGRSGKLVHECFCFNLCDLLCKEWTNTYGQKGHYHLPQELKIRGHRGGNRYRASTINVSHEPSIGLLAHEVAHAIGKSAPGMKTHTKRHARIMRKVCQYAMRHLPEWRESLKHKQAERAARADARRTQQHCCDPGHHHDQY